MKTEISIYKDGKDCGEIPHKSNMWWYDSSCEHSFKYFDLDSLYPEEYFKVDHVGEEIVKRYVDFVETVLKSYYTGRTHFSILEIGCAGGWFTKEFINRGQTILGVEGSKVGYQECLSRGIPKSNLIKHDVRNRLLLTGVPADIALCSEMAEHVEPPFAATLVQLLTDSSDIIWFSGAEPNPNGEGAHIHHCNEQPEIYWKELFSFYNFDMIRLDFDNVTNTIGNRGRQIFYHRDKIDGARLTEIAKNLRIK